MGLINSKLREKNSEVDNDLTPVMGDGYCPFYDASLVGDWKRLIALCDGGKDLISNGEENGESVGDGIGVVSGSVAEQEQELSNGQPPASVEEKKKKMEKRRSKGKRGKKLVVEEDEKNGNVTPDEEAQTTSSEEESHSFTLFVDAKGNTPLHLACRRDPPLAAVRALLALEPSMVWRKTHDGWIPLHLACHCGCDVDVANELLNVMEKEEMHPSLDNDNDDEQQQKQKQKNDDEVDRLLPRDMRGNTPLHLACASSRDPIRRPDLVRLLLLRSKDPKKEVLVRDWVYFDRGMGWDLGSGDLRVLSGSLMWEDGARFDNDEEAECGSDDGADSDGGTTKADGAAKSVGSSGSGSTTAGTSERKRGQQRPPLGRTPLNLIEDDYREELEEALLPGFSIKNAIAACRGEDVEDDDAVGAAAKPLTGENLDAMYECWAMLSILMLAAGTPGTVDRVRDALGGMTGNNGSNAEHDNILVGSFSKPCHDVVQDFQAIHQACQSAVEVCPPQFRELVKKFLQGHVDKRSMGKFSDLRSQWESRGNGG